LINIRFGLLTGLAALVISFAVGLLSGANIFYIIIRALIFAVVFFGLGFGARLVTYNFFPDLLSVANEKEQDTLTLPGSRVNITLDNNKGFALPEMYKNRDNPEEIGDIADITTGSMASVSELSEISDEGIDLNREDVYTYGGYGAAGGQNAIPGGDGQHTAPAFTPSFGSDVSGLGGLPDLDALAGAFLTNAGKTESSSLLETPGPVRSPMGNKPQPMKGDFNPKELAEGLRTVLINDK